MLNNLFPDYLATRISAFIPDDSQGMLEWQKKGAESSICPLVGELPTAAAPGCMRLHLRLFGVFPLKNVTLQVIPPVKVMVGGHSIGVLMNSRGVIVAGYSSLIGPHGRCCPAKDVGIAPGDIIVKIEDTAIHSDVQVSFLIDHLARKKNLISLQVKRCGKIREYKVKPEFCRDTQRYRIGLMVRDGAAGVGTLTFFDTDTKNFGALGHVITNTETSEYLDLSESRIVAASVQGIQKGERGRIGEKIGIFFNEKGVSGKIVKNTKYGIFGVLNKDLKNPIFPDPLPVAMGYQVKEGPATMLTVLNNETIEAFKVEIQTIFPQPRSDGKSFIVKITDPDLLRRTGGIIQGMSGSPLIQDGKLIGAVTHVFINDPERGYGVMAEKMLEEAGLLPKKRDRIIPDLSSYNLGLRAE